MNGIEKLMGLDKLNINQCQELAKEFGYDSATFELVGPKGRLKTKWLDAYFGFFQIEGQDGFNTVSQFQFAPDLYCENLTFGNKDDERTEEK